MTTPKMEIRRLTIGRMDPTTSPSEDRTIEGTAVPFNKLSHPIAGERSRTFRERIEPGALSWDDRTVLITQHDQRGVPLARIGSGTMTMENGPDGVRFRAILPESRQDVREALERGDLSGDVSIGFVVEDDRWLHGKKGSVRTVTAGHIVELSLVSNGAYPDATISGGA
jgi:HK97 family phage prohead protease